MSKYLRRLNKRLSARINGYLAVPANVREGFKKPGSQNPRKGT